MFFYLLRQTHETQVSDIKLYICNVKNPYLESHEHKIYTVKWEVKMVNSSQNHSLCLKNFDGVFTLVELLGPNIIDRIKS